MKKQELSSSAQRVQDALDAHGIKFQVVELDASTRTAEEAAAAVGCEVGQIVKSLVFRDEESGRPVLLLVSGANRVDLNLAAWHVGEKLVKADADFVRQHTGFAIGGVPPIGHATAIRTFVDSDLLSHSELWAAAGTPKAVFSLTPRQLLDLTRAGVISVS